MIWASWAFLIAQLVKKHLQCRRPQFSSMVGKIRWRRDRLPISVFLGFPCGSAGKESTCNAEDLGSIPGLGRSHEEGKGYLLQYSGLYSMDCIVDGVTELDTLSNFHFTSLHLGIWTIWITFYICCKIRVQFHSFLWLSGFPGTICWKECPFPT